MKRMSEKEKEITKELIDASETMSDFEKTVRKNLIDRGLSVPEFAHILGVSYPYLWEVLRGSRKGEGLKTRIYEYFDEN